MGFVSNSSSSSFCIYGITIDDRGENDYDEMDQKISKLGLDGYYPEGYDCWFIGKEYSNCPDDKTMGEFKKEVRELIKQNFEGIKDEDIGYHSEAYYS